jgi:hypothetical protein
MTNGRRVGGLLVGLAFVASCATPPSPGPSHSGPATSPAPTLAATHSPAPASEPPASTAPLPTETAAHLAWTKAKTNLPPRVANTGMHTAMRSAGAPRYIGVDAFHEVWSSDDGVTWDLDKKDLGSAPGPWTIAIHPFGNQLVAFDRFLDYMSFDDRGPFDALSDGKTWLSDDGQEWTSHASSFVFVDGIVDGTHLVATGGIPGEYEPTFATSTDGVTWTEVSPGDQAWRGDPSCWWTIRHLAGSAAAGYLVTASQGGQYAADCGASTNTLIWRSTDLRTWQPVLDMSAVCPRINDIALGPRGFVAVGSGIADANGDADSCAWSSRDGITWTIATTPPPVVTTGVAQLAIAPDGTFLAYGDEIWETTDGLQWYLSAPATNIYVHSFAGDLAIGCGADKTCSSLRLRVP